MENNFFIVAGVDNYNSHYWLKNTDPVMWCDEKSDCLKYQTLTEAEFDIHMNSDTFELIFDSSSMEKITVYEVDEDYNIYSVFTLLEKGKS